MPTGQTLEGVEALVEFGVAELAVAVESTHEIVRVGGAFLRIALLAAGDHVAVRGTAAAHARQDVVEDGGFARDSPETVKTVARFAAQDGLARARIGEAVERGCVDAQRQGLERAHWAKDLAWKQDTQRGTPMRMFRSAQAAFCEQVAQTVFGCVQANVHALANLIVREAHEALTAEVRPGKQKVVHGPLQRIERQRREQFVFHLVQETGKVDAFGHWRLHKKKKSESEIRK